MEETGKEKEKKPNEHEGETGKEKKEKKTNEHEGERGRRRRRRKTINKEIRRNKIIKIEIEETNKSLKIISKIKIVSVFDMRREMIPINGEIIQFNNLVESFSNLRRKEAVFPITIRGVTI